MTDDTKKPGPDADVAEEFVEPVQAGEEQAETAEPDPVEALKAENADLRDKFLRLAAEMDNLRRRTERDVKDGLIEGVEMTERSMLSTLERHGVKKIDAEGQKFDPNFHQAMFEIPNTTVPNNTVLQVIQAGFTIGDRVLRPAMVGVSKGGPKAETAASAEPGTASVNEKDA